MARVHVVSAARAGARFTGLEVRLHGLPARSIDRDTAVRWLADGHSFVTPSGVLQLIEVGDDRFLRSDGRKIASDELPG